MLLPVGEGTCSPRGLHGYEVGVASLAGDGEGPYSVNPLLTTEVRGGCCVHAEIQSPLGVCVNTVELEEDACLLGGEESSSSTAWFICPLPPRGGLSAVTATRGDVQAPPWPLLLGLRVGAEVLR